MPKSKYKYSTYSDLAKAFESGELDREKYVLVMDNDCCSLSYRGDDMGEEEAYQHAKYLSLGLFGNAFSVFSQAGSTQFLTSLEAPYINIEAGTDRLIKSYIYSRNLANRVSFAASDVVHLKYMPNPTDPRWGVGPLHLVSAEMDLDDYAMVSEIARWQNGGMPGGVFSFKNASPSQIREAQQQHRQMYAGARNGGRDLFLTEATYTPLSVAKDMNYIEGMGLLEQRILAAYRIPEAIAKLNDANLASSVTANGMYMSLAIQPTIAGVCEQETEDLLPRFGIEPGEMWFAPDDVVPEDIEALRNRVSSYVPAGVMTINEARQELGYEPIDGGELLRINGVPLDEVARSS
jgi:HK97 family phage portal protein